MQDINFILDDAQEMPEAKTKETRWKKLKRNFILVILSPFILFFTIILAGIIIEASKKAAERKAAERRRYKKVIKKGLWWDTEYLIEKD